MDAVNLGLESLLEYRTCQGNDMEWGHGRVYYSLFHVS